MSHQDGGPHNYVHKTFHDQMLERVENDFFKALRKVLEHGSDPGRVQAIIEDVRAELHPSAEAKP